MFGYIAWDPFEFQLRPALAEEMSLAISPEEWRKLRAQSKSKRCDLADVSFEQRKAWMERTAGKALLARSATWC